MALMGLKIGEKVKSKAIERFRGAKGVQDVVSVLSLDIHSAHIHYGEGVGYFLLLRWGLLRDLGVACN